MDNIYGKIIGTGHCVPDNPVPNKYFETILETDDEWIRTRTGIESRYFSTGQNTSDLGTKAAEDALKDAGIKAEDLDMIVFATISPDAFMPSTACIVQKNIGAVNAFAFDITAACSGFVYGLTIANQFIKTGQVKTVLVLGGEVLSKALDFTDCSTAVLFGDGAGAAILQKSEEPGIIQTYLGSKADEKNCLFLKALPLENPFIEVKDTNNSIVMDGREVFKFSTRIIGEALDKALEGTGYSYDDVKMIIPHQANSRLIEYAAEKKGIPKEKFYMNINRYSNTSGGTIPIALNEVRQKKLVTSGDLILLVGFGAGLTWGSLLIRL